MRYVVIIDDNAEITRVLERFFSRFKELKTQSFYNPIMALEYIKQEKVDFVVSDITMPQMDGLELLQKIRALKNAPKVIMMTAEATLNKLLASHRYDAEDFMIKPLDLSLLEKKVLSLS